MKRLTWLWKSNFVQSIDNLVSLESLDIQEFIWISFNFIRKGSVGFLLRSGWFHGICGIGGIHGKS